MHCNISIILTLYPGKGWLVSEKKFFEKCTRASVSYPDFKSIHCKAPG